MSGGGGGGDNGLEVEGIHDVRGWFGGGYHRIAREKLYLGGKSVICGGNRLTFGGTSEDCGASSSICGGNTK